MSPLSEPRDATKNERWNNDGRPTGQARDVVQGQADGHEEHHTDYKRRKMGAPLGHGVIIPAL